MKYILLSAVILITSCETKDKTKTITYTDTAKDSPIVIASVPDSIISVTPPAAAPLPKIYSNKRFRDVSVEKQGEQQYIISGKAQIFEANFSWVIEDGHNELKKGFAMTDAGAPDWGNFRFTVGVKKERENSTLTLILFESSAKDGTPQHQLFIPL